MKIDINLSKIYLSCRRGILELDIIFINFLKKEYKNIDRESMDLFVLLLNESDVDLYNWIIKGTVTKKKFFHIVAKIRKTLFIN